MMLGKWIPITPEQRSEFVKEGGVISDSAIVGSNVSFCFPVHISPHCQIKDDVKIDKFSFLNWDSVLYPNTYVGSFCSIGRGVEIGLARHPTTWLSTHTFQYNDGWFPKLEAYRHPRKLRHLHHKKTKIGSDVWVGNGARILAGVTIGHGAIIAAGAVVTKDIPPYAISGGVPAKTLSYRFDDETIRKLLALKWWDVPYAQLKSVSFDRIDDAIEQIMQIKQDRS